MLTFIDTVSQYSTCQVLDINLLKWLKKLYRVSPTIDNTMSTANISLLTFQMALCSFSIYMHFIFACDMWHTNTPIYGLRCMSNGIWQASFRQHTVYMAMFVDENVSVHQSHLRHWTMWAELWSVYVFAVGNWIYGPTVENIDFR